MRKGLLFRLTRSRLLAGLLAVTMAVSMVPVQGIQAAEQTDTADARYERIDIRTAEEFAEFAGKCYIDSWSENKYVSLKADIDLSGTEQKIVPVFNGVFDGEGHTISGFEYLGDGYVSGLFRYVERDGAVENLTVKGSVESGNEKECIGSICGINRGTIRNCTFQGTVSGRDTVGGIAGINEGTGTIAGCTVRGRITGYYSTGGIVGINHGVLNYCTNRSGINDDSAWVEEDDEMGSILRSLTTDEDSALYSGVDTGGIAGFSDGVISRCTNSGTVGYEHTGYNIGGIVGRQSGIVSLSSNSGKVCGRKDVGGIVGQMEPFIEVRVNEPDPLRDEVNKLHDLVEKTIDDMDAAGDGLKGDVDIMQSYADSAIDSGDALVTQLADFVDDNVGEVNSVSERMEHIIDMMPDILDDVTAAGNSMSALNDVVKQLSKDLDVLGKLDDSTYNETDYNRISLLSTVGGTITTDSSNPEVNNTVTITVSPEDGYKLKEDSLTVRDVNNKKIKVSPVSGKSDQYTFIMPKNNIKISATFVYQGTFLVKSTVGGRVTMTENGDQVTFQATASGGYRFDHYNVYDSSSADGTNGNRVSDKEEMTLDRKSYIKDETSILVEAVFVKTAASTHRVSVRTSTGGTAYIVGGSSLAAAGDEVTVHIVAGTSYEFDRMDVTGGIASSQSSTNVNERIFVMPDSDVDVEVLFRNKLDRDSGSSIFAESNAGGTVSVRRGASSSQYQITIRPDDGYDVAENGALKFEKVTLSGTAGGVADTYAETQENPGQEPSKEGNGSTAEESSDEEGSVEEGSEKESSNEESSNEESSNEESSENKSSNDESSNDESSNEESSNEESSKEESTEKESPTEETSTEGFSSPAEGSAGEESTGLEEEHSGEQETPVETAGKSFDIEARAIEKNVVNRDELSYDKDEKTYTYIVDLGSDNDSYKAFVTFIKAPDDPAEAGTSYNVTTASSTGGVVTVDKTSATAGERVYVTPTSNRGYVLTQILVNINGNTVQPEKDGNRYSFVMPEGEADVTAQFEPVNIILKSNLSGNATYSGDTEGKVTVSVKPSQAYTVNSITIKDAAGKKLSVSRKQSGSYLYEFDITKMSKAPCTVSISFGKQNQKQAVDTSKTNIGDAVDELARSSDQVQKSVNTIRSTITKSDGSYKGWNDLSASEQDTVIGEVMNLVDEIGDMSSAASSILSSLTTIYNILSPYVSDASSAAKKDIEKATDHIHHMLDSLKDANNGVRGIVNYLNAQPEIRFSQLGDEFDMTKEAFHDQLKGLSDSIRVLSDNASVHSDIISEDLRAVNDQINVVFNLLADRMEDVENLSIDELYEEVSDENTITTGRTDACTNKGIVKGDINVGGIAGSMSIDDEDPEDSAAGSVEYEIGRRFITKCLVTDSVNEGYVTAKKNGAGGICGYMNHGIITNSECYGSVESTEGDYVGGICGESLTIIKKCYALCSVAGNKNVGGIAGYAETLKNCYSMADVQAENGRAGAIAGQVSSYGEVVDADAGEEAKVVGNYYVGDDTYGIDNISYIGVAEPISYEELLTVEQLPTAFWHLKVIYKIEDMYLGSEEVRFGTRLDKLTFPMIPEKEGYYGVWPDVSDRKMGGTFVVEAEYKDNVTVVQSNTDSAPEEEGQWQRPYALVEDIFTEDTVLNARISDMAPPEEAAGRQNVIYEVTLENSGIRETDSFALRILNPYEDAVVYGYKDGVWTALESKGRGQYLQVSMTGTREHFCIVENPSNTMIIILCAAAAAVVLILVIVVVKKARARRKQKRQKKNDEPEE